MGDVTNGPAASDPGELRLADFPVHRPVTTRWSDNDMYGHLNNAVYYELFDSAINGWQAEHVTIDPLTDPTQGVVAESGHWVHVEISATTRRPHPLPDRLRALLESAVVEGDSR